MVGCEDFVIRNLGEFFDTAVIAFSRLRSSRYSLGPSGTWTRGQRDRGVGPW